VKFVTKSKKRGKNLAFCVTFLFDSVELFGFLTAFGDYKDGRLPKPE